MRNIRLLSILFVLLIINANHATSQIINTVAGDGLPGYCCDGSPATTAFLYLPGGAEACGVRADKYGNFYFTDGLNFRVRKVNSLGIISTVAGTSSGVHSGDGGPATSAGLYRPSDIAFDTSGNMYIAEYTTYIRKVNASGIISTVVGNGTVGYSGDGGPATAAEIGVPTGILTDKAGNLYIADWGEASIRKVNTSGIITTIAGTGTAGFSGDGGQATAAQIDHPFSLAMDATGNIYFSNSSSYNRVRKIDTSGIITTVAGGAAGFAVGDGGPATNATLYYPTGVAVDAIGNLFISDNWRDRIRKVNISGIISTYAGGGWTYANGVPATTATIDWPMGLTVDSWGNLYVCAANNNKVRKINGGVYFTGGHSINLAVCENTSYDSVNSILDVSLPNNPDTVTWSLVSGPYHGSAAISYTGGCSCSDITPYTLSYTPAGGYTGYDTFRVRAADANSSDTTTVYVTVNSSPSVITGTSVVCGGFTITLSDSVSGGTWSSSNHTVATIGSVSGITTGVSAGADTITYTMAGGCKATRTISVETMPAPITGVSTTCIGATATLYDASGGTWTSSVPSIATIGSTTGIVTGISAGAVTMTFTMIAGCSVTFAMTVFADPTPITGVRSICSGSTTTLTDTVTGGAWTSSVTGVAGIGSASGFVTGVSGGVTTITYSVALGALCTVTETFTVSPFPGTITGTPTVCVGNTTTLSDGTGGTWSSPSIGIATIGSLTGVVSGVSAGTTAITYTLPPGCTATTIVTVYPSPSVISGLTSVCTGSSTLLTDTASGGVWSSGSTIIATIGTGSGLLTGVSGGTTTVTYTIAHGCSSTYPETVNVSPAAISGPGIVCIGNTITLGDVTTGGSWTSSNTNATVGSSSGIVTGMASGTSTITYTLLTGCYATKIISVNTTAGTISGVLSICPGSTTMLTCTATGGSWSSAATGIATVGSSTGIVTGVASGVVNISYAVGAGCFATATVTVNVQPTLFTITGGGSYCAGSGGVHIGLSGSVTGVTYQLYNGAVAVGAAMPGMGAALDFGLQTAAGTYTIVATITATGCTRTMSGSVTISINPLPSAITGPSALCAGATITETDATGGGGWTSSSPAIATIGSSTGLVTGIAIGNTTITYTLPTGCLAMKTVSVSASPTAISGASVICANDSTTLTDAVGGGIWTSAIITTATAGSLTGVVTGVAAGVVTITYSLGSGCIATKIMTVNASPAAITGALGLCVGHTTSLSSTTTGGVWTSGATTIATVGSTGIVSGVSAGTAGITYTISSGCRATATVTVNALPPSITGTTHVCIATTTILSDATGGGSWSSSSTTIATVGSSTGMVTGITAGIATITYSLGSGCTASTPVTVNSNPAGISGPAGGGVCIGSTATVTDGTTGGTWSCLSTGIATIGSATGVIAGVSAGVATISYTVVTGCMATKTITVNALPPAITGGTTACIGQTTALSDGTAGGTWSSSTTSVATIGSASGIVTGVSSGTSIITYLLPTGCMTMMTITVSPPPPAITGAGIVCAGATTTWSDAVTGGAWSSGAIAIASVGSGSGIVTGVSGGIAVITYAPGTGCSVTKTVTVNPLPLPITGTAYTCVGSTTVLSDPSGVGTWSSSNMVVATVGTGTGILTGITAGMATITYTGGAGCITTLLITVNPAPTPITGAGSAVCAGHTLTLGDATPGGSWSSSNTTIATVSTTGVVTGGTTGGSVTISYSISTGCAAVRTISVTVVPPITGVTNLCAWGDTVTVHDAVATGLYSSSVVTVANLGGGNGLVTANAPGTGHITYTLPSGCTASATMTVNPLPGLITGPNHIAVGGTTTLTNSVPGGMWSSGAPTIATVGSVTGLVTGIAAGVAHITYTLPTGCNADTIVYVAAARTSGPGYQATTGGGEITVIPNPNKGAFTVSGTLETTAKQDGEVWLELTNILGQVVYKNKVLCHNGKIEEDVSVSNIANGMYLLSVRWEDGSRVKHVVVNP